MTQAPVPPRTDELPRRGPARSSRRRLRLVALVVAVASVALFGASCAQPNTPQTYDAQDNLDQTNFMQGCTGQGTGTTLASTDLCTCLFTWVEANIPASSQDKKDRTNPDGSQTFANYDGPTFIQINDDLKNHPENLPDFVQQGFQQSCGAQGYPVSQSDQSPLVTTAPGAAASSDSTAPR